MNSRTGTDDRLRARLRTAGHRFRAADNERRAAVAELKQAVVEADGNCTASDAADLTGVSSQLLEIIQPELGEQVATGDPTQS